MGNPRISKQHPADNHAVAYLLRELPEIDTLSSTGVYVRQSSSGDDDAHRGSRKTQLALQDYARRLRRDDQEDEVRLYDEGARKSGQKRIDERSELNLPLMLLLLIG